jgi:hypothetical protein
MTLNSERRVSLSVSDWVKISLFFAVQIVATVGSMIEVRERLRAVETRTEDRQQQLEELRHDVSELRRDMLANPRR